MAAQQQNIIIVVRADGVPVVQQQINGLAGAMNNADRQTQNFQNSMSSLKNAMRGLAGLFLLKELKDYADHWTQIQNKIRVFSASTEEAVAVHAKLFDVIQDSRQAMDPMVQLYSRGAQAAQRLGASQNDLINFTEAVGKSLAIQGVSTTNARGALMQLGQALGMAKLRAQEFNSINEQAPILLTTIAKQLYGAAGGVDKFRAEMTAAKVNSRDVFEALLKALPEIRKQFGLVAPTISQSFEVLNNAVGRFVGETDKAYNISVRISESIIFLSTHIDVLIKGFLVLTPAIYAAFGPSTVNLINSVGLAITRLTMAIAANPFGLIAVAISMALAALVLFRNEIVVTTVEIENLTDAVNKTASVKLDLTVADYMTALAEVWKATTDDYNLAQWWEDSTIMIVSTFGELVDGFKKHVNEFINSWQIANASINYAWTATTTYLSMQFARVVETILGGVNLIVTGFNAISGIGGFEPVAPLKLQVDSSQYEAGLDKAKKDYDDLVAKIKKQDVFDGKTIDFAGALKGTENAVTDVIKNVGKGIDDLTVRATKAAQARIKAAAELTAGVDLGKKPEKLPASATSGKKDKKAESEAKRFQNELDKLRRTLDPTTDAIEKMERAEVVLNEAQHKGLITLKQRDHYMSLIASRYEEASAPYEYYLKQIEKERMGLGLAVEQQKLYAIILDEVDQLKRKGVTLDQEQIQVMFQETDALLKQVEVQNLVLDNYNKSEGAIQQAVLQQQALTQSYNQGYISLDYYNAKMGETMLTMQEAALVAGTISADGFAMLSLGGILESYDGVLMGLKDSFQEFFSGLADGFANSVAQAIVYGKDLQTSLINVAQTITTTLISALIKLGVQWALNAAFGNTIAASSTAASAAMGAATAAAWAPAAAMVSLASYGANAAPAQMALVGTSSLSNVLAMSGFEKGGFTGAMPTSQIAGVVHGQEFVMDAESTRRIGVPTLQAMQDGASPRDFTVTKSTSKNSGQPTTNVYIENYGTSKEFDVQFTETDIRIIARDEASKTVRDEAPTVVANTLSSPNSDMSKGVVNNFNTSRKR